MSTKPHISTHDKIGIYTKAVEYIERKIFENGSYTSGFCHALTKAQFKYYEHKASPSRILQEKFRDPYDPESMEEYFPEINQYKPNYFHGDYWFPVDERGIQKRLNILRTEIEKLKKKTNNE